MFIFFSSWFNVILPVEIYPGGREDWDCLVHHVITPEGHSDHPLLLQICPWLITPPPPLSLSLSVKPTWWLRMKAVNAGISVMVRRWVITITISDGLCELAPSWQADHQSTNDLDALRSCSSSVTLAGNSPHPISHALCLSPLAGDYALNLIRMMSGKQTQRFVVK